MFPFNITNPGIYVEGLLTSGEAQLVSDLASLSYSTGDILYYDGTQLQRLPIGSNGEILTVSTGLPVWAANAGGGGGGSTISIDGSLVTDPDFLSTGDIDFVASGSNVTANINNNAVGTTQLDLLNIDLGDFTNTAGFITGYTVTQADVTAHEGALTITESQISDLSHFVPTSLLADYGFTDNSTNWDTAYGWGDHSTAGYATIGQLHDAVTVTDTSEINLTLTGQNITASLIAGSIDETKLDTSTNASLDLADSAQQPPVEGAFVDGDKTKLDGLENNLSSPAASKPSSAQIEEFTQMTTADGWGQWYGATFSIDTTDYVSGVSSAKIASSGSVAGARLVQGPLDWSDKTLKIRVKCSDWTALTEFTLRAYTDAGISDGYLFNFRNYFATPNADEWYDLVLPRSAWEVLSSSGNWSTVYNLYFRVNTNTSVDVNIDEIMLVPDPKEGLITFSFDDGYDDTLNEGAAYMSTYGYRGTAFIYPDEIGDAGYLTEDEVDTLHELGWGISGHHIDNLRSETLTDAEERVKSVKEWLAQRGYRGQNHFAWPQGSYNTALMEMTQKYFATARTIDGFNQPLGAVVDMKVNSKTISNTTSVATIEGWIDEVEQNNEWLILNFHKLVASASVDIEYDIADFESVVDYVASSGLKVLPYHEVIEEKVGIESLQPGDNVSELTNDSGFITDISSFDTDDLTEGTTNKYNATHTGDAAGSEALTVVALQGVDISNTTPTDGKIWVYRTATNEWVLEDKPAGGSSPALNDVTDVTITTVGDNDILAYDTTAGEFINQNAAEAGLQPELAEGAFADGDKTKLDNIEAGANDYTHPNHTGDVTSAGDGATTIVNDAVTFAKMQNIATNRILGRDSAGTGSVEALTLPNFRSLINVEDGADVTDTANVTAAGALMDSEVTNLADVKAFDPADYADATHTHTESDITDLGSYLEAGDAVMGTIVHGATASTARPSGFDVVTWIGSVEPTNATNDDIWYDTA